MIRTRIAPSPTGLAHIGTAYYAIYNYAFAKQHQGQFIVRIEDTDRTRFVEGSEQVIFDALSWLGIPHDEGPDTGGPYGPYRQSERLSLYKKYAEELIEKGKAYYCFCSPERLEQIRKEMQQRKETPRYDRHCRSISLADAKERVANGEKHVVRMMIPDNEKIGWDDLVRGKIEFDSNTVDDQVILKSDGFPTYHLAVVVDDHLMHITHVLRGEEWISSGPKHILLYRYLGWELPQFAHMPLLRNKDKSKMSKRKNDVAIFSYKEKGFLPEALVNYLSLMGWSHPKEKDIFSFEEYVKEFSIERIQTTGPIFDITKLTWMNQQYIQIKSDEELKKLIIDFYPKAKELSEETFNRLIPLVKTRMQTLKDFEEQTQIFFDGKSGVLEDKELAQDVAKELVAIPEWKHDIIFEAMKKIMVEKNIRMPLLYKLFTGKERGLPLPEVLEILGREKTLSILSQ